MTRGHRHQRHHRRYGGCAMLIGSRPASSARQSTFGVWALLLSFRAFSHCTAIGFFRRVSGYSSPRGTAVASLGTFGFHSSPPSHLIALPPLLLLALLPPVLIL